MISVSESVQLFLAAMDGELRQITLTWYASHLKHVAAYFDGREITTISLNDLRAWRSHRFHQTVRYQDHPNHPPLKGEISQSTKRGAIRAVKRFFNWCVDEKILDNSPAIRLRLPPKESHAPKDVTDPDLVKLIQAADSPRDRALVYVLAETGARCAGITGLTMDRVDLENNTLIVEEKYGKIREVYIWGEAAQALRDWIAVRPNGSPYVFTSRVRGQGLTASGVYQILKRLAKKAGINGRFNPHAFRHGFARALIKNRLSIEQVSELMGHSSVTVTAEAYAVWTKEELKQAHRKHSRIAHINDENGGE